MVKLVLSWFIDRILFVNYIFFLGKRLGDVDVFVCKIFIIDFFMEEDYYDWIYVIY